MNRLTSPGFVLLCTLALFVGSVVLLASCTPEIKTATQGDRNVTLITSGYVDSGKGDARAYYVLRDADTGVDYLAVVDSGIIKLEPKPAIKLEKEPK